MARTIIGGKFLASKKRPLKVIGIDIGSTMIKMVEVFLSETPELRKWACFEIPPGNLETPQNQHKKITMALKMCLRQLRPSTRTASICISDSAVIVKEMLLPAMGEKEMLENISFELSEYFSADLKEYQLSYRLFEGNDNESKGKLIILVAAAPIALLNGYKDIVRKSGLNLKYIDVSANCLSKLLNYAGNTNEINVSSHLKEALCIADLGTSKIEMSIYEGKNFKLNRTITASNADYDEFVVYELSQVLDYYHRKNYENRIAKIALIGGRSYTDGLAEYISNQLLLSVEVVRPDMFTVFGAVTEEKKERRERAKKKEFPMALYFKALGCALRED